MKNLLRKSIGLMLILILILFILISAMGCRDQVPVTSDKSLFLDRIKQDAANENDVVEFIAETLVQDISLSWEYSINVKVVNENIYLNDVLYDEVKIVNDPQISYSKGLLLDNDSTFGDDLSNALEKIKNSDKCYALSSGEGNTVSKSVSVYIIDGIYYFVSCTEKGEVIRIHYKK